jgi:hypothetical protein
MTIEHKAAGDALAEVARRAPTSGELAAAVYRIARRAGPAPGGKDPFADAAAYGASLAPPSLLIAALSLAQTLLDRRILRHLERFSGSQVLFALVIALVSAALRFGAASAVAGFVGSRLGARERFHAGVLAYLWLQAALVQPAVTLLRWGLSPHDPWWLLVIAVGGPLILLLIAAGRVLKAGFRLQWVGEGIFLFLGAAAVGWAVDYGFGRLLP